VEKDIQLKCIESATNIIIACINNTSRHIATPELCDTAIKLLKTYYNLVIKELEENEL
jgi:hypothetical protein